MRCISLSRSISAAAASTTVTAYWVGLRVKNEPWTMQPNASICSWLSPSVLSTLSLNNELENECNVIDIHFCNRLVHIEKTLKLQMPLCIPLKDKTEMIRDKTLLSIVPGSTNNSNTILLTACSFRCWIRTKLVVWLAWISFGVILLFGRPQKTVS